METEELFKQSVVMVNRVNSLRNSIELCDEAIKMLAEQPQIVINGDSSRVVLDDSALGLSRKSRAYIAKLITIKIRARRDAMAKTLEDVLDAIDEVLTDEPEKYPYPMKPKAFGAVSPDDVDL